MIIKLAKLQLLRNFKNSLMLLSNLILGMTSFVLLISVKDSVLSSVYQNSQKYLGADISVYSRQPINDQEILNVEKLIPKNFEKTQMNEMYTMVKGPERSRLIQLTAMEEGFPFYGEFKLQNKGSVLGSDPKVILKEDKVWVYPEVLKQLNLNIGDRIKIGAAEFEIDDVVLEAAGQSSGWSSMAPLIFLSFQSLDKTGLIQKGSTLWRSYLYKVPQDVDVLQLEKSIDKILKTPSLKVESHISSGEQASRLVLYFTDFLGLSGLVVLFLASIGVYFLLQSYLNGQMKSIAVLKSMGVTARKIQSIYFIQFLFLSLLAYLLSVFFVWVLLPLMNYFLKELSFFDLVLKLSLSSLWVSLILLLVLVSFLSWPIVKTLTKVNVKVLFGEQVKKEGDWSFRKILMYIPLIVIFGFLSIWISKSWVTGGAFWGSLIFMVAITSGLWILFVNTLSKYVMPKQWAWYFKSWMRRPLPTLLIFLSLSTSILLINFLSLIENHIYNELKFEGAERRPSLFIFDIQDEQLDDVKSVANQFQFDFNSVAPMIRAKLTKVNDLNFEKLESDAVFETREREREERFRNRGMNLTYRDKLSTSERVVEGEDYVGNFTASTLPPISIEKRFAERLKLKLDDKLTFDIQGVEVDAVIKSIRSIRWTSFEPNFFIQFPLGVLDLAPKTYIATTPVLEEDVKEKFQSALFEKVPNASIIDVTRLVDRISELIRKMSLTLKFITFLALTCGLLIVFSISQNQIKQKSRDILLLKWLGLSQSRLGKLYIFEFSLIAFLSSILALGMSYLFTLSIGVFVFDNRWWGFSPMPFMNLLVVSLVTAFIVNKVVKKVFATKSKALEGV